MVFNNEQLEHSLQGYTDKDVCALHKMLDNIDRVNIKIGEE